jgi:hypothetical protein
MIARVTCALKVSRSGMARRVPLRGFDPDADFGMARRRVPHWRQLLGCRSSFWMDESYDHIVPDAKELTAFRD